MTLTIDFSPNEEARLKDVARRQGLEPAALVKKWVVERLTPSDPTISDPKAHVQALLTKWRTQDQIPSVPPLPTLPGESQTETMFRIWAEEDARMTDAEREAENQLWEEIQAALTRE